MGFIISSNKCVQSVLPDSSHCCSVLAGSVCWLLGQEGGQPGGGNNIPWVTYSSILADVMSTVLLTKDKHGAALGGNTGPWVTHGSILAESKGTARGEH